MEILLLLALESLVLAEAAVIFNQRSCYDTVNNTCQYGDHHQLVEDLEDLASKFPGLAKTVIMFRKEQPWSRWLN